MKKNKMNQSYLILLPLLMMMSKSSMLSANPTRKVDLYLISREWEGVKEKALATNSSRGIDQFLSQYQHKMPYFPLMDEANQLKLELTDESGESYQMKINHDWEKIQRLSQFEGLLTLELLALFVQKYRQYGLQNPLEPKALALMENIDQANQSQAITRQKEMESLFTRIKQIKVSQKLEDRFQLELQSRMQALEKKELEEKNRKSYESELLRAFNNAKAFSVNGHSVTPLEDFIKNAAHGPWPNPFEEEAKLFIKNIISERQKDYEARLTQDWKIIEKKSLLGTDDSIELLKNFLKKYQHSHFKNHYETEVNRRIEKIKNHELIAPKMPHITWVKINGSHEYEANYLRKENEPIKYLRMDGFYISKTEITVSQYMKCVKANVCLPPHWDDGVCHIQQVDHFTTYPQMGKLSQVLRADDFPVTCVTHHDAKRFAQWIGAELPSHLEWEYAARSEGKNILYPWAKTRIFDAEELSCDYAVMNDWGAGCGEGRYWQVCQKQSGHTRQGLCDMGGNVAEWTADGSVKGGSWIDASDQAFIPQNQNKSSIQPSNHIGFRVIIK